MRRAFGSTAKPLTAASGSVRVELRVRGVRWSVWTMCGESVVGAEETCLLPLSNAPLSPTPTLPPAPAPAPALIPIPTPSLKFATDPDPPTTPLREAFEPDRRPLGWLSLSALTDLEGIALEIA